MGDRFRIIDGSHRLTAYFYLGGYFNIEDDKVSCLSVMDEQEYWVAEAGINKTISKSEQPEKTRDSHEQVKQVKSEK